MPFLLTKVESWDKKFSFIFYPWLRMPVLSGCRVIFKNTRLFAGYKAFHGDKLPLYQ